MPILLISNTVSTGIEPAISCVTGRRVNRYTTRPKNGDSYGTRTRVTAVKGRCLNLLDQGAVLKHKIDYSTGFILKTRHFYIILIFLYFLNFWINIVITMVLRLQMLYLSIFYTHVSKNRH